MDFSVLVSVYKNDNKDYFFDALKSVCVNQSVKPKQLVLIVDGPLSFNVNEVLSEIQKENDKLEIIVHKNETNVGLAKSLNIGLKLCRYDWVARMDADDISSPSRFEKQINFLFENPHITAIGGWIDEFNNSLDDSFSIREVPKTNDEIIKMAKKRSPMNHPTVFFRKNDILSVGGYSENFGKLEDYKLWIDLIIKGFELGNVQDILVHMRVGENFIKRRSNRHEIHDWDLLQKYLLKYKMINHFTALRNRIYIRAFIYMPGWLKAKMYKRALRKQRSN